MDVDSLYISALLRSKKPSFLKGMKKEFFDEEWMPVFSFIRKFNSKYGKLPKRSTVKDKFRELSFQKAVEPVPYYAKEMRTRFAFNILDEGLRTNYTSKRSGNDLSGSIDALKGVILTVERQQKSKTAGGILRINKNTAARRKAYLERKKLKGILGIQTPWPSLDAVTQGWQPGDLIVVLARSGIGKTFASLLCMLAAQRKRKRGLYTSMELYPDRLGIRYDGLGAGISIDKFRKGKLSKSELKKLDKWYSRLENSKRLGTIDFCGPNDISSPLDLELAIQLGGYDFVVWDSFYRAAKKKKWEEFAQLVTDAKTVATRTGVPIMITSQFNKDVKKTHTTADQISAAFTDSIMHDADFVFALFQTPSMKLLLEMLLRSLKVREGMELGELLMKWDIDNGDFSEVSSSLMGVDAVDDSIDSEMELTYDYS